MWMGRIWDTRRQFMKQKPPIYGGFLKRLMGLEPTTFCMASRRSSQLSYSRPLGCAL
jgi:hypothetical protein